MDFHPIIVHFPVALLTCYGLMELIRIKRALASAHWFYIKAAFLLVGSAASFAAYKTGEFAAGEGRSALIATHARFAKFTIVVFGIMALVYLLKIISPWIERKYSVFTKGLEFAEKIRVGWLGLLIALAGLMAITVTGALGGAIAYGPTIDPVVSAVYYLLIK